MTSRFYGPYWADLGLSYGLLGLVWGVLDGILRHLLVLEGPSRCRDIREGQNLKHIEKPMENHCFCVVVRGTERQTN